MSMCFKVCISVCVHPCGVALWVCASILRMWCATFPRCVCANVCILVCVCLWDDVSGAREPTSGMLTKISQLVNRKWIYV